MYILNVIQSSNSNGIYFPIVLNLPKVLGTYEVLWAIGTMFGATTRVDMINTRTNTFGRCFK
jgi:hypothetical protein